MVLDYYKLREQPFGVTPDSRYLFLSAAHREALASLLYGIEAGRGFVALIAKPGMGKTTLLFHALNQLRNKARTVFLFQTICTPVDLLRAILTDLGVRETQAGLIEMQSRLNELLREQFCASKRFVVVIDEAQNLDDSVLELVRMLSNFETPREKLMQIILSGQPQFGERIALPELVQLRQRVSMFASLEPFSPEDTALYIDHRTRIAGYSSETPLFTTEALALIARYSEGIPRNINNLCFNALSLGYALKRKTIDCEVVREVVTDLDLDRWQKKSSLAAPERGSQEIPTFVSAASAPSMFAGLLPKLALVMAIVLAMAGAFFGIHRWAAPKASAQANRAGPPLVHASPASLRADQGPQSVAPAEVAVPADRVVLPLVAAVPSSSSADPGPLPMAPASTILVTPNRTVLGICVQNFGRCNPELLQEILRLNPRLRNLDHIESGQRIRIPGSAAMQNITEQSSKASLAERDTQ
jgi:type II secretory pathway predicted ATPase ExeA